jgi:hypothetical protein
VKVKTPSPEAVVEEVVPGNTLQLLATLLHININANGINNIFFKVRPSFSLYGTSML